MKKKFKIFWTNIAQNDLEEIINYITQDSRDRALVIFRKIRKQCSTLENNPFRCRIVPELLAISIRSYREMIIKPYRIIFRIEDINIYILGVLDSRRNLEDILLDRVIRA